MDVITIVVNRGGMGAEESWRAPMMHHNKPLTKTHGYSTKRRLSGYQLNQYQVVISKKC